MTFIKNQDAIRDYGYVEIAIAFDRRTTFNEIVNLVKSLPGYPTVKRIRLEAPEEAE
jgi:hypothetical protein